MAARALVYEVNLEVEAMIADDFRAWLDTHVAAMLALPGFVGACSFEVLEPAAPDGWVGLCVQYTLHDRDALDAYLRDHASTMRADGQARFGGHFLASRRVLQAAVCG